MADLLFLDALELQPLLRHQHGYKIVEETTHMLENHTPNATASLSRD